MKTLSIIILSYNVERLLLNCLKSIPQKPDWEIIVVDNASQDNSVYAVKKNFPTVKIIENKNNIGFSAGNNIGIKLSKSKFILLLNPDTLVYPQTIETVLGYIQKHSEVGAATCRVELPNGELDYSSHRGFPSPMGSLLHFIGLKKISKYSSTQVPNYVHEIDSLTGAFALIRREAGDQVKWLDEDYYWNGEDIDFCYKLKESGWKIVFIPEVKITHFKGSSAKATKASRQKWAINSTNVMEIFYKKHLAQKNPPLLNLVVYCGIKILKIIRFIKNSIIY
jgi:GT2 family glycosyltransferase